MGIRLIIAIWAVLAPLTAMAEGSGCGNLCALSWWKAANSGALEAELALGTDIHARDKRGRTALHWAARKGTPAHIARLIDAGAVINSPDNNGWTPLHWAAEFGKIDNLEMLARSGGDVDARNTAGITPRDMTDHSCGG